jgi:hypothetical protein
MAAGDQTPVRVELDRAPDGGGALVDEALALALGTEPEQLVVLQLATGCS